MKDFTTDMGLDEPSSFVCCDKSVVVVYCAKLNHFLRIL